MAAAVDRERMRAIGRMGGRATAAKGHEYMSELGKRGFAAALELGYGEVLARKLAGSYRAKFGRDIVLGSQSREKARLRAQARRIFGGNRCDVLGCDEPGQVHHRRGLGVEGPNGEANIRVLCRDHHIAEHRRIRRAHKEGIAL